MFTIILSLIAFYLGHFLCVPVLERYHPGRPCIVSWWSVGIVVDGRPLHLVVLVVAMIEMAGLVHFCARVRCRKILKT